MLLRVDFGDVTGIQFQPSSSHLGSSRHRTEEAFELCDLFAGVRELVEEESQARGTFPMRDVGQAECMFYELIVEAKIGRAVLFFRKMFRRMGIITKHDSHSDLVRTQQVEECGHHQHVALNPMR